MSDAIKEPEKLSEHHIVEGFDSGVEALDRWLEQKSRKNEEEGASRTYVVSVNDVVVGYFCLSAGQIVHELAVRKVKRNMPNPVPVMVLGRLAVDKKWHGKGIGRGLVKEAILRTLQAAEIAGIKAIVVHAKPEAKAFYKHMGFTESPVEPLILMLPLQDVAKNMGS